MKKYKRFCIAECRLMPTDKIGLVCYISWLVYEGEVSVLSYQQYLSGIRQFGEALGILLLPPNSTH